MLLPITPEYLPVGQNVKVETSVIDDLTLCRFGLMFVLIFKFKIKIKNLSRKKAYRIRMFLYSCTC